MGARLKVVIFGAFALLLVILLFILPRSVIKQKETGPDTARAKVEVEELALGNDQPKQNEADLFEIGEIGNNMGGASTQQIDSLQQYHLRGLRFDSALFYAAQLYKRNPGKPTILRVGDAYLERAGHLGTDKAKNGLGKALEWYNKALALDTTDPDVLLKIATVKAMTDQPMAGISEMLRIIEKHPKHVPTLYQLGVFSLQTNQHQKAIERFESLLEAEPNHINGTFYLGVAHLNAGNKNKARNCFLQVRQLSQDPEIIAAANGYLTELN